ncbi:MAG: nucleotidyl transferase AbiEii/AbiGii toxin family protein [Bacteroidales bacterium]|jgi:predicted nucleotidyltransferase component of viral defense system|nr:nucleotidyl transferase AbiEii/AbiGii toxin family protein [Bacteroidales bacterium]
MKNDIFEQMLARYDIKNKADKENAMHEVMQQIALAGLYRGGFFERAAFYGGTCLRIFHNLPRFSEDMDFSLLETDGETHLEDYFEAIVDEFKAAGREITIAKKEKKTLTNVESAFLKDNTEIYNLKFNTERSVKIKIEVDITPPLGFSTEYKLLILPFSFMVRCYTLPDLYAGKISAFLFRKWQSRVKGRDWYDFEWYVRNGVPLNLSHLQKRAEETESFPQKKITKKIFIELMNEKIKNTDISLVKKDVFPFIKDEEELQIWTKEYFLELVRMIKFLG